MNNHFNSSSQERNVAVTIFYSNYSGNCKALLQLINNSNLMDKLSLKFINVDNNIMKNIITKKFTVVPSIVVMIEDEISLYTGNNVFEWFNIFTSPKVSLDHDTEKSSELKCGSKDHINKNITTEPSIEPQKQTKSILEIAAELSKARETL